MGLKNQRQLAIALPTITYHHSLSTVELNAPSYIWEEHDTMPFDELIISWNMMRPQYGEFKIQTSVKIANEWSPWFLYASWASNGQKGGNVSTGEHPIQIQQDLLQIVGGSKAEGFRILIEASEGALIEECYSIHACISSIADLFPESNAKNPYHIDLKVPLISQMMLPHPRHRDMCSAVATSSAISYLLNKNRIDPIFFALQARDEAFDVFGNWALNTAHASAVLGKNWQCWVQRLRGFDEIYAKLYAGIPVVVSVRGPLTGSASPYNQGHLLTVKGYLPKEKKVLCMDPAFPEDAATNVSYDLQDFMEAWSRRQYIAYVFQRQESKNLSNQ